MGRCLGLVALVTLASAATNKQIFFVEGGCWCLVPGLASMFFYNQIILRCCLVTHKTGRVGRVPHNFKFYIEKWSYAEPSLPSLKRFYTTVDCSDLILIDL